MAVLGIGPVMLSTPYKLPFAVLWQPALAEPAPHDVTVRVVMAGPASRAAAEALDATLLPFLLLLDSGALAGPSIEPWTSTIVDWSGPRAQRSTVEWTLTSVHCDPQAWVVLAQMLLTDHRAHPMVRIEIADAQRPNELVEVRQSSGSNPYPRRWSGLGFTVDFYNEIYKEFTVRVRFVRSLSDEERGRVSEALFGWMPGLVNGAYGVAPVPPERCIGLPDRDIVFVDNELEWIIRHFTAHTGAVEGLINIVASISTRVVQVAEFSID